MTRFRATISWEYDSSNDKGAYGTDDPYQMAAIDAQNDPNELLASAPDDIELMVEPVG